jgi:carboxyl-terminal processing protease
MKSSTARYIVVLFIGALAGAIFTLDMVVQAERSPKETAAPLPFDDLKTFTEIYTQIKTYYVEPVDDKKLFTDAVQGMLSGLDPHSSFLDKDSYRELREETKGEFGGLGIEVTMENGFVKVVTPIEDTPAAKAGVKTGDLVIRLDDKAVKGMTLQEAVRMMRGKPGTPISLTIAREGEAKPIKVTLTRSVIKIQSVKQKLLDKGYGYVRITQFQETTVKNLGDSIERLKKENNGALKGLVLDLRNNPGGVLEGAIGVSDAFLDKGLIVYTKGRINESRFEQSAKLGDLMNGAPIVVLINGGSASASEIVAGALQDHQRAIVMGTKSFGKGSVQTIVPMSDDRGLKLTTARYYTPNGRSIQAVGIEPDIVTEDAKITKSEEADRLREADLMRHLENSGTQATLPAPAAEELKKADSKKKSDLPGADDYQVQEALNLLKGISIYKVRGG